MWLHEFQAQGLRCFKHIHATFSSGINVLYGDNGVGKTSILEGISVLSCGKSFRTSKLSHVINDQINELTLFGEVQTKDNSTLLGIQHKQGVTELRVDRQKVSKWSQLAKNLPILEIHPESYLLITGGPIERRKFLNWGMFHVEPSYGKLWLEYNRALKQRNHCLRHRHLNQASNWHQNIAELGNKIVNYLEEYTNNLKPYLNEITELFQLSGKFTMKYYPGWDQQSELYQLLNLELQQEEIGLSTMHGPHRGDLKLMLNNKLFSKSSSRGQQKVLAIALKIAQAKYLKQNSGKESIYLIDELPAELDQKRREIALNLLTQLNTQIIISAVSKDSVKYTNSDTKWFHVEQGCVTSMV